MNLNKYYGYVYVSADNVNSKYELSKVSEPKNLPLCSKQKKKLNLHMKKLVILPNAAPSVIFCAH